MATTKKADAGLDPEAMKERERSYRNGVDISLHEVACRFEADDIDWYKALIACGYSEAQINAEVEND